MSFIPLSAATDESLVILVTGFAVVFAVLLLLIGIIMAYAAIVSGVQNIINNKKKKSEKASPAPVATTETPVSAPAVVSYDADLQTIAVIAAAVEAFYGEGASRRIKSISRTASSRSEWAAAGLNQNISARRGF
ncbi:MAG: OadG family protein [Ruminococcus sp.]|nr:OadG family protein [Ruminococcus sp.]